MLNKQEMEVIHLLADAWNKYIKLQHQHPCDKDEFCHALHICQHLVMIRDIRRQDADNFPIYDEKGEEIKNIKVTVSEEELLEALTSGKPIEINKNI